MQVLFSTFLPVCDGRAPIWTAGGMRGARRLEREAARCSPGKHNNNRFTTFHQRHRTGNHEVIIPPTFVASAAGQAKRTPLAGSRGAAGPCPTLCLQGDQLQSSNWSCVQPRPEEKEFHQEGKCWGLFTQVWNSLRLHKYFCG